MLSKTSNDCWRICCDRLHMRRSTWLGTDSRVGVTLVEILIVLAIAGVLFGLAIFFGRGTLESRQDQAGIRSIQQSIWQGSSAASARGRNTELIRSGRRIEVREVDSGRIIRWEELPANMTTSLPQLVFTPPGKISDESFALVADGITVNSPAGTTVLRVSIIGEVLVEED